MSLGHYFWSTWHNLESPGRGNFKCILQTWHVAVICLARHNMNEGGDDQSELAIISLLLASTACGWEKADTGQALATFTSSCDRVLMKCSQSISAGRPDLGWVASLLSLSQYPYSSETVSRFPTFASFSQLSGRPLSSLPSLSFLP